MSDQPTDKFIPLPLGKKTVKVGTLPQIGETYFSNSKKQKTMLFKTIYDTIGNGDSFNIAVSKVDDQLKVSISHQPIDLKGIKIAPKSITADTGQELDEIIAEACESIIEPTNALAAEEKEYKDSLKEAKKKTEKAKAEKEKKEKKKSTTKDKKKSAKQKAEAEASDSLFNQE